jgi:hypothetical protein
MEQENLGEQDEQHEQQNHPTGASLPALHRPCHRAGVSHSIFDVIRRKQNETC